MRALLGAVFIAASFASAVNAAPNLVIIDVCSLRADHLGAYGSSRQATPRMDALAREGVVFDNALAQSSWCLPNYATLFTGLPAEGHGLYTNDPHSPPDFAPTLAEKLRDSGYDTAAFSGGVYLLPAWGLTRGFNLYVNTFSTAAVPRAQAPLESNLDAVDGWLSRRAREKKSAKKSFFLYIAVDNLHAPVQPRDPGRYDASYEGIAEDTRTMGVPFARAYSGEESGYAPDVLALVAPFKSDPSHLRHLVSRYDSALKEMDEQIGRFLETLKRRGLQKDTIVVLTGDHGESFGEHGLLGHTQGLYEPTLRVPMIIADPSRPRLAGRRYSQLVEREDLMPTLLDWAGVDVPALNLPGRSLEELLRQPSGPWRRYAFASSRRNLEGNDGSDLRIDERVVRDERWKLHAYSYKDSYELYDLADDPGETRNLAQERPDVVSRLSLQLLRRMEDVRPHRVSVPDRAPIAIPSTGGRY